MNTATIKKEKELKNNRWYYKIMLKKDSIFSIWWEQFGSFDKEETNAKYYEFLKCRNINKG